MFKQRVSPLVIASEAAMGIKAQLESKRYNPCYRLYRNGIPVVIIDNVDDKEIEVKIGNNSCTLHDLKAELKKRDVSIVSTNMKNPVGAFYKFVLNEKKSASGVTVTRL